ncbi:MAG TPA: 4Fe-4S dicluster domain-containing protein [bacterium]|nr:4Fe-4S dicluster domain-containing protein [bacterium]
MEATVHAIGYGAYAILYVIFFVAVALFLWGLKSKADRVRRGLPETRSEHLPKRIRGLFDFVLFQKRLFQDLFPGLMHAFIFWGFLAFALGYAILFLQAHDYYGAIFGWLFGGRLALAYNAFIDFFAVLVILGVVVGMIRRYIWRPERLEVNFDAGFVLMLIFSIMATNLLGEGALVRLGEMGRDGLPTARAAFVGRHVAGLFSSMNATSLTHFYIAVWWIHISIVLGFLVYLPHSKHFHIVLGPVNVLLRNLGPYGALTKLNIEGAETFGAAKPYDLKWKSLLDLLACAECGRCQDHCPAHATEKPLSPKKLILDLKDQFLEYPVPALPEAGSSNGKEAAAAPAEPAGYELAREIGEDAIWSCTTCRACEEHCPVFIEHVEKIVEMRRNLVLMASRFPQEVTALFKNLETNYNPWPLGFATRADWAKDLALKVAKKGDKIDVLVWTGCAGAFDDRNKKVVRSLVGVLRRAGIEPYFLGTSEKCCGDPARRSGNEYLYQTLAEENVALLNGISFKTLVTTCPHCYNTILNEYPQFGGDYVVEHYTTYLKRLLDEGRLTAKPEAAEATYHDSCYLGRYSGIYDAPREVLRACGVGVKEAKRSGAEGFCCGAGGARMWMEESLGTRINHSRLEQLRATGASRIYTACPYCLTMLSDAVKEKEASGIEVADICELVDERTSG